MEGREGGTGVYYQNASGTDLFAFMHPTLAGPTKHNLEARIAKIPMVTSSSKSPLS